MVRENSGDGRGAKLLLGWLDSLLHWKGASFGAGEKAALPF